MRNLVYLTQARVFLSRDKLIAAFQHLLVHIQVAVDTLHSHPGLSLWTAPLLIYSWKSSPPEKGSCVMLSMAAHSCGEALSSLNTSWNPDRP